MKNDEKLLSDVLKAFCLTRDYVGPKLLPPVNGWEWFDICEKIVNIIPDDEWAEQFRLRCDEYEK